MNFLSSANFCHWDVDCHYTTQQLGLKKKEILKIAKRYGAQNVRVFGSIARGDANDKSDVDILVDLEPGRTLMDLGGLLMDLQELLGCHVDVATEKGLRERIKQHVLKEAKLL